MRPASSLLRGLAVTAQLVAYASSQTINVDGQVEAATEANIAPAGEDVTTGERLAPSQEKLPEETVQLTDAVLSNLTDLGLSNISLFYFDDPVEEDLATRSASKCKLFPGDWLFPGELVWKVFNLLTGNALIKTVPLGAACYEGEHYDAEKCQFLLDNWANSTTHINDPTSVMSPLYQGATCQPQNAATGGTCELGGFPLYSVDARNVAQIQLAVNFARSLNLRLVVHNTGHDFLGKNTGAGALSIWTHNLKSIKVIKDYKSGCGYQGPAFKLGAGVQVHEIYETAEREGYTAVGGECRDVGVVGGYAAGGGHSPISPIAGLGSDQILSVDIVTPDGRFITADQKHNKELFWVVRGGGAATWGVVTSMTFKVYPKMSFSGMAFSVTTAGLNITEDQFWGAVHAYWRRFPEYSDAKSYGYHFIFPMGPGAYVWSMNPWIIAGLPLSDFKTLVAPLLEEWSSLGVHIKPEFFEYESFYPVWRSHFPGENVGSAEVRTGSRLIPRKQWDDEALLKETLQTLRGIAEEGSPLIMYNINAAAPEGTPHSAANPAWRDALMFVITGSAWAPDASADEVAEVNRHVTHGIMQKLKDLTPGSGGYGNEGDLMDPDFGQSFFGSNYPRLYSLKQKIDPRGVFYAPTAVGSEDWYIEGSEDYLTVQTGRLCRK